MKKYLFVVFCPLLLSIIAQEGETIEDQRDTSILTKESCYSITIPKPVYGIFTDQPDGQSYKNVTIGTLVWMTGNLEAIQ